MRLSASEPHVRTVWLVLLRRIGNEAALIYAATPDWRKADSYYYGAVEDSCTQGGSHIVLLVPWFTSADTRRLVGELVTGELPVAREFRPCVPAAAYAPRSSDARGVLPRTPL